MLIGVIFLAGCTVLQLENNKTQNKSSEQNRTVGVPKEFLEKNITKNLCEQKIVFDDAVISFDGDCIVMNISDSVSKQPIPNTTVKLAITPKICITPPSRPFCIPEIISEKQTGETGLVFFYKEELDNHELIKHGRSINTIIFDVKGYNTTEKTFDYEYNQLINFELEPIKTYCKQDSDCVSVAIKCCSCDKLEELKAVNKRFVNDFKPNCGSIGCTAGCPIVNKIKILCENNKCILSPMDVCQQPSDCIPSNYGCVSRTFCNIMIDCQATDERYKCISCTDNICFP